MQHKGVAPLGSRFHSPGGLNNLGPPTTKPQLVIVDKAGLYLCIDVMGFRKCIGCLAEGTLQLPPAPRTPFHPVHMMQC